ncbi:MAG: VWA domain-containing protein [Planctomycetota bacterium]
MRQWRGEAIRIATCVVVVGCAALFAGARWYDEKYLEGELKKAVAANNHQEIAGIVGQLAALETTRALEIVLAVGEQFPADPVRSAVLDALTASRTNNCLAFYAKQLAETRSAARAMVLIETLYMIDRPEALTPLLAVLTTHKDTRILLTVVRALRAKPTRETIDALLEFFRLVQDDRDSLWAETRVTLLALTEQNYELHDDWAKWWVEQRTEWKPKTDDDADGKARTAVFRPDRKLDLPQLFGQEIASKRVVFVIDTSKSMKEKQEGSGGAEEGSAGKPDVPRLELAKMELIRAIDKLRPDVRFNVIAYNTTQSFWQDGTKLLPATAKNKKSVTEYIRNWRADGFTNTEAAVMSGLALEGLDTLILLSDGSPTDPADGKLVDWKPILEAIRAENRFKKVTIHTLGFKGANTTFMKTLAKQNGGTFASIK